MENDKNIYQQNAIENIVELKNITKSYTDKNVLDNLNIVFKKGSFNVLIGKSGCGKSTILKIIMGLEKETSGTIINNAKTSMVFQNSALMPWRTVYENIMLAIEENKNINQNEKDIKVKNVI